jgi:hypothetical protein
LIVHERYTPEEKLAARAGRLAIVASFGAAKWGGKSLRELVDASIFKFLASVVTEKDRIGFCGLDDEALLARVLPTGSGGRVYRDKV